MDERSATGCLRPIDVLVLVGVVLFLVALLLPAMPGVTETARQAACLNSQKQLGLALLNMESAFKRLPPSSHIEHDADGNIVSMDGFSWCVDILPYLENVDLYRSLDVAGGAPLDGTPAHTAALGKVIGEFHCPSFEGDAYIDPTTEAEAITNYKALGATHIESLNVASPNPTVPKYAPNSNRHPDGGMFPDSRHGMEAFKIDGTSQTALLVETVEQNVARWTVGSECVLVGLPPVVTFAKNESYWHPTGYTSNQFWDQSTIPREINHTYLDWDYDEFPYDDGGITRPSAAASGPIKYGPSSHHSGVTNHTFADGSVHVISNEIDAALYMFIITRNGNDPMPGAEQP